MNIRALLRRVNHFIVDLVYPVRTVCLCCRERSGGDVICSACGSRLDHLKMTGSVRSGLRMHINAADVRSVWKYSGEAAQLVRQLKYYCVRQAAEVMADAMAQTAVQMNLPHDTIVTGVAMPDKRRRQRGIDHGRLLADMVAQRLGLECRELLVRAPGGHTQRGLNREKRIANLNGRFTAVEQTGRPVLLIDDVLTTGATAAVCTETLLRAGSGPVWVLTATCVSGRDDDHV